MRPLGRPTPALRATALLALGALAVHELRYALAYGSDAGQALARQGHGYLGELAPALFVLAASAILGRLVAAALGRVREAGPAPSARHTTLAFAAALLAIFGAQELVEGAVFAGHPGGLAAIFAHGGWLAIPLALAMGFLAARADRLLGGVERALARRVAKRRRLPKPGAVAMPGGAYERRPLAASPLAFGLARRPPPAHSVP